MTAPITPAQIRAALGLLEWKQTDLATAAGVTPMTITRILSGVHAPQERTLEAITKALIDRSIVFLPDNGVAMRDDTLRVYDGTDDFFHVLDDAYYALKSAKDKTIRILFSDFSHTPTDVMARLSEMQRAGFSFQSIIETGGLVFGECRTLPPGSFFNNPKIIYADRTAIMVDKPDDGHKILVIHHADVARMELHTFDLIWKSGKPI